MPGSYSLSKTFSMMSLTGVIIVSSALVFAYHRIAESGLVNQENRTNAEMARILVNILWPRYGAFLETADTLPRNLLKERPEIEMIRSDIIHQIRGLRILKVKIYSLNRKVVFSTDSTQIGDVKNEDEGLNRALNGSIASEIVYKNEFSSFEGKVFQRSLTASYVPVYQGDSNVSGVLEVYSDVTPFHAEIDRTGYLILGIVASLMTLLYAFLFIIIRNADQMLRSHRRYEEEKQRKQIHYVETHDEFTGLKNRRGLDEFLEEISGRNPPGNNPVGILIVKLDRLKRFQDNYDRKMADVLLNVASERIRVCSPMDNEVFRLDGDEFAIVHPGLLAEEDMEHIAEKILNLFAEPINLAANKVHLNPSIGISNGWPAKKILDETLKQAYMAMNEARVSLTRNYCTYNDELEILRQAQMTLEMEIGRAIHKNEFILYYQPRMKSSSKEVCGAEALLRWQHPEKGLILPDSFVPILEESGYIIDVGKWLLHEACTQAKKWLDCGERIRVSVNISPKQLSHKDFTGTVMEILHESCLPPELLELEITENILISDHITAAHCLKELRNQGIKISIDDFGTGYSSLSYLMYFPVDYIKIDRSFIRDMMHNHDHTLLINAMIAMARSLNLRVVAEGVETVEQQEYLINAGCDELQGFLFSMPSHPEAIFCR